VARLKKEGEVCPSTFAQAKKGGLRMYATSQTRLARRSLGEGRRLRMASPSARSLRCSNSLLIAAHPRAPESQ
jgi:hypothetical protein